MDWLKLFAFVVAVVAVLVSADRPKKKIRIHLPQKVKHIHHHKKIYITSHPASANYAPAYMPSAEGAVAVPTNVALPDVASLLPVNSVEVYEDHHRPSASKLLPLYKARGYYGPNQSEWDDQDYDLAPPPEAPERTYPSASATVPSNYPPKRVKIIKVKDFANKKQIRKPPPAKPKRVVIRGRPFPEDEHPVSTFHEQFYSELEGAGTIRKIKKPPRVEKIIDGDTEHVHTYSEEHIHKIVFDEPTKVTGVVGVDPLRSLSALTAAHPLMPLRNAQALLALHSEPLTASGPFGAPSQLEYSHYSPRDVTHDHIFHDHGEIPAGMDLTKEVLALPPKASYTSQGVRISGGVPKRNKAKSRKPYLKAANPTLSHDLTYYESIYSPDIRVKKIRHRSTTPSPNYDSSSEVGENFRLIPEFRFKKDKPKTKKIRHNTAPFFQDFQQASAPAPFSLSSTVVHDYKPKTYPASITGSSSYTNFKDPFVNFKDSYSKQFEYDTYASSSNVHTTSEDKNDALPTFEGSKGKHKSVSTQNIRFGDQGHQSVVDHLKESTDDYPTAFDQTNTIDSVTSTPYTIKESSPAHPYYTAMALKALKKDQLEEASNTNYQYLEPPTASTDSQLVLIATTTVAPLIYKIQSTDAITVLPSNFDTEVRQTKKRKEKSRNHQRERAVKPTQSPAEIEHSYSQNTDPMRGKLKYGDKI